MLSNRMAVYSRKPLYRLNERLEVETLLNVYDTSETVQVWYNNTSCITTKINERLTIIPETGDILFKNQEDVAKCIDILRSENFNVIFSNAISYSKIDKRNELFNTDYDNEIYGLFSIKPFDDICNNPNLMEVRYIDKFDHICKVKQIDQLYPEVMGAISNYMMFHTDICDNMLVEGRLIFELAKSSKDDKISINHFVIDSNDINTPNAVCYSIKLNYPVFLDQYSAKRYRFNCNISNDECRNIKENLTQKYDTFRHYTNKEISRQTRFKITKIVTKYAIANKKMIIGIIAKLFKIDIESLKDIPFVKFLDKISDSEIIDSGLENIANTIIDNSANKPKYAMVG